VKILVAGAGAIGQWLGARLSLANHDVTLLTRQAHAQALANKLTISGNTDFAAPLHAVSEPAAAGTGFDAVFITGKAHQTAALGQISVPCLSREGFLVSLQNGFGNSQKLQQLLPAPRIAVALTSHGVTVQQPGHLFHAGVGATLVGPAAPDQPSASLLAQQLLGNAGLSPEFHHDMRPLIWRKAIANCGINPVGALHRIHNGEIAKRPELLQQARALVAEGIAVAHKASVVLPPGDLTLAMEETLRNTAANKCSMLQDVEARRPTEIEQITGRLIRLAAKQGVPVPQNQAIYEQIKQIETTYLGEKAARMALDEQAWERHPF
jgi:2-dehydropantoate 2-reductase